MVLEVRVLTTLGSAWRGSPGAGAADVLLLGPVLVTWVCSVHKLYALCVCSTLIRIFLFFIFRASLAAYGSSQARSRIGAAAAYTTATATLDLSCICDLCCSLWQCWILNMLSEARDRTFILTDTSRILNPLSHNKNANKNFLNT